MQKQICTYYKKALVTGGRVGIGRAIVEMLLAEGVEVWTTSRANRHFLEHPNLHILELDLVRKGAAQVFAEEFVKQVPDIDLLINNAGYGVFSGFENFPLEQIEEQLRVLLESPIVIAREIYPILRSKKRGAIVNVSSLATIFPMPYMSMYIAAKAGLSGFSRELILEAVGSGVNVVDFQLGDFRTDFNQSMTKVIGGSHESQVWDRIEENLNSGPAPQEAASALQKYLLKNKSGVLLCGGYFQAHIAPFLARFASWRILSCAIKKYFRL